MVNAEDEVGNINSRPQVDFSAAYSNKERQTTHQQKKKKSTEKKRKVT